MGIKFLIVVLLLGSGCFIWPCLAEEKPIGMVESADRIGTDSQIKIETISFNNIYMYRDSKGVVHFTNTPSSFRYRCYSKGSIQNNCMNKKKQKVK